LSSELPHSVPRAIADPAGTEYEEREYGIWISWRKVGKELGPVI
jgi:hypothetical protein